MTELEVLRTEIEYRIMEARRLEKVATDYWDKIREMQKELYLKQNGLSIGDRVEYMDGGTKKIGVLTDVIFSYGGEPSPVVNKIKKDGKPSLVTAYVSFRTIPKKIYE